jgi:hypothetical protein
VFQVCYKGVSKVLQVCHKGVARLLQRCYKGRYSGYRTGHFCLGGPRGPVCTRVLQGCYKGVKSCHLLLRYVFRNKVLKRAQQMNQKEPIASHNAMRTHLCDCVRPLSRTYIKTSIQHCKRHTFVTLCALSLEHTQQPLSQYNNMKAHLCKFMCPISMPRKYTPQPISSNNTIKKHLRDFMCSLPMSHILGEF